MPKTAYTFEVTLLPANPMAEAALDKTPVISRTLRIGGSQTLHALHRAIFNAFDRFDEHLYEFQIGAKRPMDRKARCWQPPVERNSFFDGDDPPGDASKTKINSLELKLKDRFFYWFDFGDDWWHEIRVKEAGSVMAGEKLPKVVARVGKSPPQYPELEE